MSLKAKIIVAVRVLLGIAALVVVGSAAYSVLEPSAANSTFRLREIHYRDHEYLDTEGLNDLIRSTVPENILQVDLHRLRRLVKSEPWVREAAVRRQLPDRIIIHVTERRPVAVASIEGEIKLVDEEGVILDAPLPSFGSIDRPIVRGLKNLNIENARQENSIRMGVYLEVLKDLDSGPDPYSTAISEVIVENPERVAVVPADQALPVYLGKNDFRRRYEAYLSSMDYLLEVRSRQEVESIDVSHDDRVIIRSPEGMEADDPKTGD